MNYEGSDESLLCIENQPNFFFPDIKMMYQVQEYIKHVETDSVQ